MSTYKFMAPTEFVFFSSRQPAEEEKKIRTKSKEMKNPWATI